MRGAMEIQIYLFREGVMEKKFEKTTCKVMEIVTVRLAGICKIRAWGYGNRYFFPRLGNGKQFRELTCKAIDFLLGRRLQDPCVGLWKSGGVMKKTIRKSTCKAMQTLTFHAASICKIHAWGYGNLFFSW